MKTIEYGSEYLRELRDADVSYFDVVKTAARECCADAADIAEACYWFAVEHYRGQADPLYASQCVNPFRPGPLSHGIDDDGGPAAEIYTALVDYENA